MKSIRMVFTTPTEKTYSLTLRYAKDGLTEPQVRTAMQAVIDGGILTTGLTGIEGAEIIDRTVTDII